MTKAAEERKKKNKPAKDFFLGGGVISFSAKPEIKASTGGLSYVRHRGGGCFLTVAPFKMNGLMKTSCLRPQEGRAAVSVRLPACMIPEMDGILMSQHGGGGRRGSGSA